MNVELEKRLQKFSAAEVESRLRDACEWLGLSQGRCVNYAKLLREFNEEGKRSREHILAINESFEIIDIYALWKENLHNFSGLEKKIKASFNKGPILREDENPGKSTNQPRNDAFVYLLSGVLLRGGAKVITVDGVSLNKTSDAGNADIIIELNGIGVVIECKRPQSKNALKQRVEEACGQIDGANGIIAIDCSAFIRPPNKLFEAD